MAIPSGVCRVSLVGTLGSDEVFDTSFWTLGGAGSLADAQFIADGVAGLIKGTGAFTNTLSLLAGPGQYSQVRVYAYPTGGPSATWVAEASLELTGTGTTAMPYQTCAVVSLRTAESGRSARGRMYLPATGIGVGSDHQMSSTFVPDLAEEWATLLTAVDNLVAPDGGNPSVVVVSQTRTNTLIVDRVIVDSRLDIQRRRANKQQPSTTSTALLGI
jgi:hypothetical protein